MKIAVVGAGSWGTALAAHLRRRGDEVRLWAREPEVLAGIRDSGRNPFFLSDVDLPSGLQVSGDVNTVVDGVAVVLMAVPSEFVALTLKSIARLPAGAPVMSATKGFDPERHLRMTEVIAERFPEAGVAALSGPTFAREVALGRPTAAVVASRDAALATRLQEAIGTREFRLYTNADVVGVEAGGALKNVMAIATGIADGLTLGENARGALITRGLAEITRLAVALGAQPATLAGLAGMGDLVLTCTGSLSRNRALGIALAKGSALERVEGETRMIAEGARTVRSALALARRHGVRLPICEEVAAVLFEGKAPAAALTALLDRAPTREDA
jgi:glycerol-3-phosphate dehydrogenase (NAD(P)+)